MCRQQWAQSWKGVPRLLSPNRLATVEKADRVVLLDKGRVVETGSHHQLLARGWAYPRFARRLLGPGGA